MDGRRFRWCLYGGLLASAVGCHRGNTHDKFGLAKPGQTVGPVQGTGGGLFGKSSPSTPSTPPAQPAADPGAMPGLSADFSSDTKPRKSGTKGFSPDTLVTFGDTWSQAALTDPPPSNRDELLDRARHAYQKALEQDKKNKGAMLGLARQYARVGDRERAAEAYRKYLDAHPKDADVYHEIALAHGQWKDWAGGVTWAEAGLRLDPENRKYRKTLGFCQARAGKWDDALGTLCQIMPEAQARHNLAGLLDHMGEAAMCRLQLQLAVQADPGYAPAREFLTELDQGAAPGAGVPAAAPNPIMQTGYQKP